MYEKVLDICKSKKKDQIGITALEHQGKVYIDSLSKANLYLITNLLLSLPVKIFHIFQK